MTTVIIGRDGKVYDLSKVKRDSDTGIVTGPAEYPRTVKREAGKVSVEHHVPAFAGCMPKKWVDEVLKPMSQQEVKAYFRLK